MGKKKNKETKPDYSLYDMFTLGDRIMHDFQDKTGQALKKSGIIMAVDDSRITVLWDRIEGEYPSEIEDVIFESYNKKEILNGDMEFKFIKKHKTPIH